MLRKLLLCPWFGDLPDWFDKYLANIEPLKDLGYEWLITTDLGDFKRRVKNKLDVECPIVPGTGKVHDYRACLGVLFEEELQEYDYYGHADFDCVFGRIDHFMSDSQLSTLDIWSNHADRREKYGGYICGPWTLYKNNSKIHRLFLRYPDWRQILSSPEATGWVEFQNGYTGVVDAAHNANEIARLYTMFQTQNLNDFSSLRFENGMLYEGNREIMMAHFRRLNPKRWPL